MTHKLLTPAEVAEITARVSSSYAAIRKLDGACDSHIAEAHMRADIDALLSDRLARGWRTDWENAPRDIEVYAWANGRKTLIHWHEKDQCWLDEDEDNEVKPTYFMLIQPPEKDSGR